MRSPLIYVGCAGWNIPRDKKRHFPEEGSALTRYSAVFNATEINSSFRNEHRQSTYARWAASVPASFRFSVKLPQAITHENRLSRVHKLLPPFIDAVGALENKLGALLMQLPPSFEFSARLTGRFFERLRKMYSGPVVLEPRHLTWFSPKGVAVLNEYSIDRVAADPLPVDEVLIAATWSDAAYFRLHGAPRMYYSAYTSAHLNRLANRLMAATKSGTPVWCIFDNTASGAAAGNALTLVTKLEKLKSQRRAAPKQKGGSRPLSA
jgi:uncharacterized protein YecE (DUF72 family)